MGRRRSSSPLVELVDLVARLPWWAAAALGVLAYAGFHWLAEKPLPRVSIAGMSPLIVHSYIRGASTVLQWVVPGICFIAAVVSAVRRHRRERLFDDVTANPAVDALDGISWQEFEQLVGEAFRMQGYRVTETGGGGADGGVDLVVTKDGEKWLVQCKQWRAFKVGVSVVRELYGVMAAQGAAGGYLITSGRFTEEARGFAEGRNVRLVDGPRLQAMLRQVRAGQGGGEEAMERREPTFGPSVPRGLVPACPLCARPMTRRVARKGTKVGEAFWGCTGFPACRGTKVLDTR